MGEGIFIPDMVEEDDAGIAAEHPPRLTLPVLAAPFPDSQKTNFNAIRRSLVTVACKDVPGAHYAFDSSLLAPQSKDAFTKLKGIIDRHPGSPASIFGHADPEGDVVYNKFLSERRAEAVFGMLIRDVPTWERLFSDHSHTAGDVWGDDSVELMLGALAFTTEPSNQTSVLSVRAMQSRLDTQKSAITTVEFRSRHCIQASDSGFIVFETNSRDGDDYLLKISATIAEPDPPK